MLITLLLKLSEFVINPILEIISKIFDIAGLDIIIAKIQEVTDIIFSSATGLMWLFFDFDILELLIKTILAIEISFELYRITIWAIKKIPKFNVS